MALDRATGDDPVTCGLCGHQTSIAMIQRHLVAEHGYDADELAEQMESAPIVDTTDPRDEGE